MHPLQTNRPKATRGKSATLSAPVAVRGAALMMALALALAGCTSGGDSPAPAPSSGAVSAAPSSTPSAAPVFNPNGSAADNLAFFDSVNTGLVAAKTAAGATPDGQAFTTALRDAGFAVADMQVTPDVTTVGVKADSIQFSVAMKGQCLIGQYGFGEYHSLVAPLLGSGKCLIGETRAIDW